MKVVTKYRANDGTEWDTPEAAQKRDALCAEIDEVMNPLPMPPRSSGERIAVDRDAAHRAKERIVALCRREFPNTPVFTYDAKSIHPFSVAGRILDDTGGPLRTAWQWFMCYDAGYLYEQPYFALNPDKWEPKRP